MWESATRGRQSITEDMGNSVIMPGFIDLNALGDIDHDILHKEVYRHVKPSLNPSEEYFNKGTHELMTAEDEAFKSLFAYAQLIRNGVTTAMPITSTYYKKWADTYEEEEAGVHHAGKLGLRLYTSPSYQCGMGSSGQTGLRRYVLMRKPERQGWNVPESLLKHMTALMTD